MKVPGAERWQRLSPLLDGLLDLEPAARADRLDALRAEDPALADELASLVADAGRAEAAQFLSGSASAPSGGAGGAGGPGEGASLAGQRIGAYVLEAPIGQGGTGTVWRARRADGRFEGAVAVKLLHLSLVGRTGALRFEREGMVLARLSHPHIARLLDAGVEAGSQPYLVLELVDGERIDRHCDAKQLRVGDRVALFRVVLDAVAHAHRHLVIHRDIKPGNILVDHEGSVKLLDFGIAKLLQGDDGADPAGELTGEGMRALTPDYAAPEQLRGEDVTTATDVYALGVLLYLLLTGRHPTAPPHATPADAIRATLDTDPGRLSTAVTVTDDAPAEAIGRIADARATSPTRLKRELGGDLENIVAKALRKAQAERYPTVDAFADDLHRWAAGEPVSARADSLAYRTARFVGRHRGAVAAALLIVVAILAGLVGTISQARRAEAERAGALNEARLAREERDQALVQQRLQRGTNEFLQLMMRDAAGGDPGAVRKQLDRAVTLIEKTRFEHPLVKISLLRQMAGRYLELGLPEEGVRLIREAAALLPGTDLAAKNSAVPVNLACSLARYLMELDDVAGAEAELDRADALIAGLGSGLSVPSLVDCRYQRSAIALARGDYAGAIEKVQDGRRRLDAAGIKEGEQSRVLASALSSAELAAGRHAAALAIARPLLAESEAGQGHDSIAVLRRADIVTSLARLGGDPLAALPLSETDRATAARVFGSTAVDAAIELEHGLVLDALGRHVEAAETLARAALAAEAAHRPRLALTARLAQCVALVAAERLDEASALFAGLQPAVARALAPQQLGAAEVAAVLAMAHGNLPEARATLDRALQRLRAGNVPAAPSLPREFALQMLRGELALAEARSVEAIAIAGEALASARARALDPARSSDVGRAVLLKAQALQGAGRLDEARSTAGEALLQLEPTLGAAHPAARAAALLATATSAAAPARGR